MLSSSIKSEALRLGFEACGICKAEPVDVYYSEYLNKWLANKYNGEMTYMSRNVDKRCNPQLLVENAQSVIVVALNYYPEIKQTPEALQVSYYAYGKDYHLVMKEKLYELYTYISQIYPPVQGRCFCDTAPVLEKYHAQKAGLGWIGKNTQLIIPGKGSYFFLGVILIDKELEYDVPFEPACGSCQKCMQACPTKALVAPGVLNANCCLSYLTIEHKGTLPFALPDNNQIYGCDICNKVCPQNKTAQPTSVEDFRIYAVLKDLSKESISQMDENTFKQIFKNSPINRVGLERLKNILLNIEHH